MRLVDHSQELFDKVARHLLTQKEPAMDESKVSCRYRSPDGKMCAVGCLISDKEYSPKFEGIGISEDGMEPDVRYLILNMALKNSLGFKLNARERNLLSDLQRIHDNGQYVKKDVVPFWLECLEGVANHYSLSAAVVSEYA